MTAPVKPTDLRLDPLAVLIARAEARALLWQACEFGLHEAVDELQAAAERDELVERLGQDQVQRILRDAFHAVRDEFVPAICAADDAVEENSWCEAAVDYHADRGDRVSLVPAQASKPPQGVPTSTSQAAELLVLTGDAARLRRWLAQHSAQERSAIRKYLEVKRCRSRPTK